MKQAVESAIATADRATVPPPERNANATDVTAVTRTAVGTTAPLVGVNTPAVLSKVPSWAVTVGGSP